MHSSFLSIGVDYRVDELYTKYNLELGELSRKLRSVFHRMQQKGFGATFGDVEGEILYMLVREHKPNQVFEISPDCGWSTNYILAALTQNGSGTLHSFELDANKNGKPTESVIRGNQHPEWDLSKLRFHLGDARETVKWVPGEIGLLFIDSYHKDSFAKWYIESVLPRVKGPILIHDIAFADQLEGSSEARYVWNWATTQQIPFALVGLIELELAKTDLRSGYAERRSLRSNTAILRWPPTIKGGPPKLKENLIEKLSQAESMASIENREKVDKVVNEVSALVLNDRSRVNRHRLLFQAGKIYSAIGEYQEANRAFQRAIGISIQADAQQRVKALSELSDRFASDKQWTNAFLAALLLLTGQRRMPLLSAEKIFHTITKLLKHTLK